MLDPFTMQMGMMGVQALMGADQAEGDAYKQMAAKQAQDHLQRMEVTRQNYQAAEANASQWMQNTLITEQSYTNAAEEQVYLKYNFDNATGQLSRKARNTYDTLTNTLSTRNIKGGTSRALMRQQQQQDKNIMEARAVTHGNQMRDTERKRDQQLAKRNFGYQKQNEFHQQIDMTDPKGAFDSALTQGIVQAGVTGIGMYQQTQLMGAQQNYQLQMYNQTQSQLPGGLVLAPETLQGMFGSGNVAGWAGGNVFNVPQ